MEYGQKIKSLRVVRDVLTFISFCLFSFRCFCCCGSRGYLPAQSPPVGWDGEAVASGRRLGGLPVGVKKENRTVVRYGYEFVRTRVQDHQE